MRVQFEFTLEDLLDATRRSHARSKVVASWRWQGLVYTALLTWFVVFMILPTFIIDPGIGALMGIVTAALSALMYPSSQRKAIEKRLRKFYRELFGDAKNSLCEWNLRLRE